MNRFSLKPCFTLIVLLFTPIAFAQESRAPLSPADGSKSIHAQVKAQVLPLMRDLAKSENISIDEARWFYSSVNDGLVATVPLVGVEKLKVTDFVNGQNIGIVHFSSAISTRDKKEIPSGSYVARIVGDPTTPNAKAQLLKKGRLIAEVPMQIPCKSPSPGMALTWPLRIEGETKKVACKQGQPAYTSTLFSQRRNHMAPILAQVDTATTRCYGFIMYCRVAYSGGYYSDRWYWCGFCFGFWW